MDDRLCKMFADQHELLRLMKADPLDIVDPEERVEYIRTMTLALIAELYEMLNEVGWKPWATSRHVNEDAAFGELRDALQFLMNLMMVVTLMPPEDLAHRLFAAHQAKLVINASRVIRGYDGVAGKCPQCHRDLEEVTIKEVGAASSSRVDFHCPCGAYLGSRPV